MKFLLPLAALVALAAAGYSDPKKPVEFKEPEDLATEMNASTDVQHRIHDCKGVDGCYDFLKRAYVKGNTKEERYADLVKAINSVEVQDYVKLIDPVADAPTSVPGEPAADDMD
ncbi:hypothetical protein PMAYCL1PPCAC_00121 [Pristionchus mayeri]|uniref:Uncharacterized protein n=1 Tax=Pristionchus mayeri TaxID=1317129 RepID=A0AAN4YWX2_9BILA|nr:hypothetical protein PMAYCL1PPCAC_00121 [Pristionchus mayeri]